MQKIAMISLHTCPLASEEGKETGGQNVYVLELSKELGRQGFLVDIFTRSQSPTEPKIVQVSENVRVIHLAAGVEKPIAKKLLPQFIDEFVQSFWEFTKINQLSYDILHCHYYLSGLAGIKIREKIFSKIPLLMTFHTLALLKNLVARDELEKEETFRIASELTLTKKADHIIASSQSDKEYLLYLYDVPKVRVSVVLPGVNAKLFVPMEKNYAKNKIKADLEHRIVLFVGRIEPLKGIDVLIYAMKILHQKDPKLRVCLFVVGGDISQPASLWTKELKKLDNLRILLNLETSVKFVGRKSQAKLPYYYNAAEFVVMPSHYESFGMVALEAMACGVPVITTNVTGIAGILEKEQEKLITSANNPLELSEKMEYLLSNKSAHDNLSQEVRERVQNLTWENTARRVSNIYKKL